MPVSSRLARKVPSINPTVGKFWMPAKPISGAFSRSPLRARAKAISDLTQLHPHPGPLPSDGRGRMVRRRSADPTTLGTAEDRAGCSLSRRMGAGQGEGQFVRITPPTRYLFLHKP